MNIPSQSLFRQLWKKNIEVRPHDLAFITIVAQYVSYSEYNGVHPHALYRCNSEVIDINLLYRVSQDPQCDPDDFTKEYGWSLRVSNFGRPTDLLIAVTSYNEVSFML
jgi:hypothetical protein